MTEILILKKRKDFIRVANQGFKMVTSGLILQAARSLSIPEDNAHLGYTVTKKIGKANLRNRTKRRLRAAAREVFPKNALSQFDYVLIGRFNTAEIDFIELKKNMSWALRKINKLLQPQETQNEEVSPLAAHSAN